VKPVRPFDSRLWLTMLVSSAQPSPHVRLECARTSLGLVTEEDTCFIGG